MLESDNIKDVFLCCTIAQLTIYTTSSKIILKGRERQLANDTTHNFSQALCASYIHDECAHRRALAQLTFSSTNSTVIFVLITILHISNPWNGSFFLWLTFFIVIDILFRCIWFKLIHTVYCLFFTHHILLVHVSISLLLLTDFGFLGIR